RPWTVKLRSTSSIDSAGPIYDRDGPWRRRVTRRAPRVALSRLDDNEPAHDRQRAAGDADVSRVGRWHWSHGDDPRGPYGRADRCDTGWLLRQPGGVRRAHDRK